MSSILSVTALIAIGFAIYYSITARRYLRQNVEFMRFYKSKGNIAMGIALLALGLIQMFAFGADTTGWRIAVGLVFAALGSVNFIYGVKFYRQIAPKVYETKS